MSQVLKFVPKTHKVQQILWVLRSASLRVLIKPLHFEIEMKLLIVLRMTLGDPAKKVVTGVLGWPQTFAVGTIENWEMPPVIRTRLVAIRPGVNNLVPR